MTSRDTSLRAHVCLKKVTWLDVASLQFSSDSAPSYIYAAAPTFRIVASAIVAVAYVTIIDTSYLS